MPSNRAILLTPPGVSAIAVVRLLGPDVQAFIAKHFSKPLREGRAMHGQWTLSNSQTLDDPLIARLPDGGADINLHGGTWILRTFFDLLRQEGFEVQEQSHLPADQSSVDGPTLIDREVAAFLPLTTTELGVRALVAQPSAWNQLLSSPPSILAQEKQRMLRDRTLHHLLYPPRVAIVGAPNVGKSSLANHLFARDQVITADMPGTTRDWVGETANLDGLAITLVDTPGIRETDDAIEAAAIANSRTQIGIADLVIVVLDATRLLAGDQAGALNAWPDAVRVINKCDRARAWHEEDLPPSVISSISSAGTGASRSAAVPIHTSAITAAGIPELIARIRAHFGFEAHYPLDQPRCWTLRHWGWLVEAPATSPLPEIKRI